MGLTDVATRALARYSVPGAAAGGGVGSGYLWEKFKQRFGREPNAAEAQALMSIYQQVADKLGRMPTTAELDLTWSSYLGGGSTWSNFINSLGPAAAPPAPATTQAQAGSGYTLQEIINTINAASQANAAQQNQIDLMSQLGFIAPSAFGLPTGDFSAALQQAIASGQVLPTLAAQQLASTTQLAEAQLALQQTIAEMTHAYQMAQVGVQQGQIQLGYAGLDVQKELAALDAQLQKELQQAQLALEYSILGFQQQQWGQQYQLQKEQLGLSQRKQEFEETIRGLSLASTPGLNTGAVPSIGVQ